MPLSTAEERMVEFLGNVWTPHHFAMVAGSLQRPFLRFYGSTREKPLMLFAVVDADHQVAAAISRVRGAAAAAAAAVDADQQRGRAAAAEDDDDSDEDDGGCRNIIGCGTIRSFRTVYSIWLTTFWTSAATTTATTLLQQ